MGWLDTLQGLMPGNSKPAKREPVVPEALNLVASPRAQYPTQEEAQFAQKQDYSYGDPSARYATGQQARFLTGNPNVHPLQAGNVTKEQQQKAQMDRFARSTEQNFEQFDATFNKALDNYYMKGLLAVQASPLAKLGFDPSKVAADFTRKADQVNILGTYSPKHDEIYANLFSPSTIVHESIHRGLEKLRGTPFWKPEFDEIYKGHNEDAVRYIMTKKMGNPEQKDESAAGELGQKQIEAGKYWFENSWHYKELSQLLANIEQAAADYIAAKRPGGPR